MLKESLQLTGFILTAIEFLQVLEGGNCHAGLD